MAAPRAVGSPRATAGIAILPACPTRPRRLEVEQAVLLATPRLKVEHAVLRAPPPLSWSTQSCVPHRQPCRWLALETPLQLRCLSPFPRIRPNWRKPPPAVRQAAFMGQLLVEQAGSVGQIHLVRCTKIFAPSWKFSLRVVVPATGRPLPRSPAGVPALPRNRRAVRPGCAGRSWAACGDRPRSSRGRRSVRWVVRRA